jgi:hypothetical protein
MDKKTNEEMFNSPGHKGNANQNHVKIHLTPLRIQTGLVEWLK